MTSLDKLLKRLDACSEAREWAKGKTLEEAWNTCPRSGWMRWLAHRLGVDLTAAALAEYERVTAPAGAKYGSVTEAALAEYERVTEAALAEYERVTAPALAEYERVKADAWAEYGRVTADVYRVAVPYSVIAEALRSPAKYPLEREDAST